MSDNKNVRRVSTPDVSDISSSSKDPFHNFRSLRSHRSHKQLTKKPKVSVILEVDTDAESNDENKPKQLNQNKPRPVSMNSLKFDLEQPIRMSSTRDSRRSTKSIVSTISTKSLDLTTFNRNESTNSSRNSYDRTKLKRYESSSSHNSYDRTGGTINGHLNNGFQNSNNNLHRSTSSIHSTETGPPVVREQYFCCRKWSKREKILTTVVATLIILVCGLVVAIGIVAEKRAQKNSENFLLAL
ncbi:uncharacterized protein LOC129605777 [Condylostylus longicornis]|uniref:uncharacterized protein LOC129605777 n=1 Tax=Condylostylus longicornis TaxID=2530218 RepID=UPI00244DE88C|nr:uncharacterized protein LOC129605777 [Condylostylus longicornis]